jgi:hypothetical protein
VTTHRTRSVPRPATACPASAECRHCAQENRVTGPGAKVVARYADGRLIKGYSYDFVAGRHKFHVFFEPNASGRQTPVLLAELKAVFFVRNHAGNAKYDERKGFEDGHQPHGRIVEIRFRDGEVLVGSTTGDPDAGPGVLFTPADPASNNVRVYAVWAAIRQFRFLPATSAPTRLRWLPARLQAWLRQPVTIPWTPPRIHP